MTSRKNITRESGLTTHEVVNQVDAELLLKQAQSHRAQTIGFAKNASRYFPDDVNLFREFVSPDLTSVERDDHPVTHKIFEAAAIIIRRHHCRELRDQLISEVTISLLSQSRYAGHCSITAYLLTILDRRVPYLKRQLIRGKHKYADAEAPGGFAYCPLRYLWVDDEENNPGFELPDHSTEQREREIVFFLSLEAEMKELMKRSDIHRVVGEMIRDILVGAYEDDDYPTGRLTRRHIAEAASAQLGRSVSPYRAEMVLDDFKPVLAKLLNRDERQGPDRHA